MELVVAVVLRAHGIRGALAVELRTDDPDARLAPGSTVRLAAPGADVTARGLPEHEVLGLTPGPKGPLLMLSDVHDRTAAEGLRGARLVVDVDTDAEDDGDSWYPHQLVGLAVVTTEGEPAGEVLALEPRPAHDVLVVRQPSGEQALVPFVRSIVPEVDVAGGRVVVDPPAGLLQVRPAPEDEPDDGQG